MRNRCTYIPQIMLPKPGTDLSKWSVVACDQYTSQAEYWAETDRIVGNSPSTLRLTLPEVYLEDSDMEQRAAGIHKSMKEYTENGTLETLPSGVILTERLSGGACSRRGIVMALDLEAYEYQADSQSLIRPTEKTVVERIPPRLKVRQGASIELPHIMILIDDPNRSVIEPLFDHTASFQQVYNTDLMQGGGHINGWFIPKGNVTDTIEDKLEALCDRNAFNQKYNCTDAHALLPYAVGDGNHSMATAKAYWEETKKALSADEQENHPARYALVEIVNIHDESLIIEPIHRVMFGVDTTDLLAKAKEYFTAQGCSCEIADGSVAAAAGMQAFPFVSANQSGTIVLKNASFALPLANLQAFLDQYLESNPSAKIDYIHGDDVVTSLGTKPGNIGFFLPDIAKNDLFRGVIFDGVLPRKTFSMGEAHEKRYYMEAKTILK